MKTYHSLLNAYLNNAGAGFLEHGRRWDEVKDYSRTSTVDVEQVLYSLYLAETNRDYATIGRMSTVLRTWFAERKAKELELEKPGKIGPLPPGIVRVA